MLPYPTDRRRLLMMVRVFLHEFSEFMLAADDGWPPAAYSGDDFTDQQLERMLERLAVDAGRIEGAGGGGVTTGAIRLGLEQDLCDLLQQAAWNRIRPQMN